MLDYIHVTCQLPDLYSKMEEINKMHLFGGDSPFPKFSSDSSAIT